MVCSFSFEAVKYVIQVIMVFQCNYICESHVVLMLSTQNNAIFKMHDKNIFGAHDK